MTSLILGPALNLHTFLEALIFNIFGNYNINYFYLHSKKCWVVSTQIWVKVGQSKRWVKNVVKKCTVESER